MHLEVNATPPSKRRRAQSPRVLSTPPQSSASQPVPLSSAPGPTASAQSNGAKWFRNPSVVWFRGHDLRVEDHPALLAAAQRGGPVAPLFIWDEEDNFGRDLGEMKRWWLKHSLLELTKDLKELGVPLYLRVGRSPVELRKFLKATGADAVFWNRCYEPDLLQRDEEMRAELGHDGMTAESFKAELLVEPWELSKSETNPAFDTFHVYMRAWMAFPPPPQPFPCPSLLQSISAHVPVGEVNDLCLHYPPSLGESLSHMWHPGSTQAKLQLEKFLLEVFPVFGERRCRRHFKGTSRLSPHVRFGELSPRRMYHATKVRVSRGDPNRELSAPLAAVLGVPGDGQTTVGHSSDCIRRTSPAHVEADEGLVPSDRSDDSEASARGALVHNDWEMGNLPENGLFKKVAKKPRSIKGTNHDKTGESNMHESRIHLSARAFLKNLCLRDYGYHILFHHPNFDRKSLIPEFEWFPWARDKGSFEAWRQGRTGYPAVDAAMRELRATGWVHNSMRFLLACFLTKYLLLPWQNGLKEFYSLLLDGDHSSNALGWQWTSGSNTDSFPFSCLVNPVKFGTLLDPSGDYVRQWVPELAKLPKEYVHQPWNAPESMRSAAGLLLGNSYPLRIVDGAVARRRAKDAMSKMKSIFAEMRPSRMLSTLSIDALVREWPQESCCNEDGDQQGRKLGLRPSLWSLFQTCDSFRGDLGANAGDGVEPDSNNSDSEAAGFDSFRSKHNSIEHALLTAHSSSGHKEIVDDGLPISNSLETLNAQPVRSGSRKKVLRPKKAVQANNVAENASTTPDAGYGQLEDNGKSHASRLPAYGGGVPQYAPMGRHPAFNAHHHQLMVQSQLRQVHQAGMQHQIAGNGMVFESLYGAGMSGTLGTGVPLPNFPVMMGHGPSGIELGVPNGMNAVDFSSPSFYAHQMNMTHMYGLPSMIPMVSSQMGGRLDQDHSPNGIPGTAASASGPGRAVGMAPNFSVPYGMYGSNPGIDPNGFPTPMGMSEADQYAAFHAASLQNQPGVHSRTPQSCVTPQQLYMSQAGNLEGGHISNGLFPGAAHLSPMVHNTVGNGHRGNAREIAPSGLNGLVVPGRDEHASEGAELRENNLRKDAVTSAARGRKDPGPKLVRNTSSSVTTAKPKAVIRKSGSSNRGKSRGTVKAASPGDSSRRRGVKATPVVRLASTRGRRGTGSRSRGGKTRADAQSSAVMGGNRGMGALVNGETGIRALKSRIEKLESVGQKEENEYFHFARFLTGMYELTENTDRHTSKDYIRLCTLKDNYHKQCESDKEKLKIYRIKAFFSKILDLDVTGEWDRHNHGGVRGPYVYGIRLKPGIQMEGATRLKTNGSSASRKTAKG